jgi:hypothetical protein
MRLEDTISLKVPLEHLVGALAVRPEIDTKDTWPSIHIGCTVYRMMPLVRVNSSLPCGGVTSQNMCINRQLPYSAARSWEYA